MQCTSYFYSRDQNVDASGILWQQFDGAVFSRSGRDYNILFQPPSIDQYLVYNRELLRETMLKHEAIFKYQVHELHRLYGRQRELMDEIERRELNKYHLQVQTSPSNYSVSGMQCDTSKKALQIPCWLLLNPRGDMPSAQGVEGFQKPSSFYSREGIHTGSNVYLAENHLKELDVSSRRRNKHGKLMLDLELPAEELMDSDEGEQLEEEKFAEVSSVLHDPSIRCIDSLPKSNLILDGKTPSNLNTSCRKTSCLFDLNEPVECDEPVSTTYTSLIDLNASSAEVMQLEQDLSGNRKSEFTVLNEVARDILEGKGSLRCSIISGLRVSFVGKSPLSCNDKTSLHSTSAKKDQDLFDTNRQRMLSPCVTPSPQFVQLFDQTNTGASTSVSSQRASFREVPIAIQALPCFNSPDFISRTSKSSIGSSGMKEKYLCSTKNRACSTSLGSITSHMSSNSDNQTIAEHYSVARCVKDSDQKNPVVDMDLNVLPSSSLQETEVSQDEGKGIDGEKVHENSVGKLNGLSIKPDHEGNVVVSTKLTEPPTSSSQFCAITLINSPSNSSENEDIQNGKKSDILAVIMASDPSHISEICPKDDTHLATESGKEISESKTCFDWRFSISEQKSSEVSSEITGVGTDLEAPISPDNKEHSPPREESEDNQSEKLRDSDKDLDRIAAEAIISISLSGKHLNTSIDGPLEASVDCLNWFAGIVSSVAGNVGNGFEDLPSGALRGNCNELAPNIFEYSEATTFKFLENKVEDPCYMTIDENKMIGDILLPSRQGRGRARKAREWKEFQSVLPCAASLGKYDVTKNLRPVEGLTVAARTAAKAVKVRKNMGRVGRARGRRQSKKFPSSVVGKKVCSGSEQQIFESEQSFLQRCLFGWGKKNRRQKHRRARNSIDLGLS
ncbi:hypothetical protein ACH5RR_025830 [Cinchona calisaya]|uniref:Uncharacterized protein n=1 Tax=Cinchona calisaya TaxID=153742 RepID=A0ABD2Z1X2_9GENT